MKEGTSIGKEITFGVEGDELVVERSVFVSSYDCLSVEYARVRDG